MYYDDVSTRGRNKKSEQMEFCIERYRCTKGTKVMKKMGIQSLSSDCLRLLDIHTYIERERQ